MKKIMFALLLIAGMSCTDEAPQANKALPLRDDEKIENLVQSVQPLFASLREKAAGKKDLEMVSFEIVKDRRTGAMTLLNFKSEPFFPIARREVYERMAGDVYSVTCTTSGKSTTTQCSGKFECGSAIAKCLDGGGCANVCRAPNSVESIRLSDVNFFSSREVDVRSVSLFNGVPLSDLERAKINGTLSSVKLYTLIL